MRAFVLIVPAIMCFGACATTSGATAPTPPGDPIATVDPEVLYQRGVRLGQAGDFVRAEQYLSAAIERGFSEDRAMPPLLDACLRASRLVAALGYAQPYLTRHPEQWALRLVVASIHMGLGQPEEARSELERVLHDTPDAPPPQAHYFLAVLHRDAFDDADGARTHFRRYLELEPEGSHAEEARSSVLEPAGGLPQPIPAEEVPPAVQDVPLEEASMPTPVEAS